MPYGGGVRAGRNDVPASPADIAVTFASRAGLTIPSADGHVLGLPSGGGWR